MDFWQASKVKVILSKDVNGHMFRKMKYLEEIQGYLYGWKLRVPRGNRGD